MPLVSSVLHTLLAPAILTELQTAFPTGDAVHHAKLAQAISKAISDVMIQYITTSAVVNSNGQAAPGAAVQTAGSAAAQVGATVAPSVVSTIGTIS